MKVLLSLKKQAAGRQGEQHERCGAGGTLVGDAQGWHNRAGRAGGPRKPRGDLAGRPGRELRAETQPSLEAGSQAHR